MARLVRDAPGVSADAGTGELQPHAGYGPDQEQQESPKRVSRNITGPLLTASDPRRRGGPLLALADEIIE